MPRQPHWEERRAGRPPHSLCLRPPPRVAHADVGLGFSVFVMIIIIEIFGSPFLRNCSVVIGLLFGYLIAGVTTHNGDKYVTAAKINSAPVITFPWVQTFPLKV